MTTRIAWSGLSYESYVGTSFALAFEVANHVEPRPFDSAAYHSAAYHSVGYHSVGYHGAAHCGAAHWGADDDEAVKPTDTSALTNLSLQHRD
jgi:hypothetical protein